MAEARRTQAEVTTLRFDSEALHRARKLMADTLGLDIEENRLDELARIAFDRAAKRKVSRFSDYLQLLSTEPAEMDCVIDLFMVGETHFFRQADHFEALIDIALPHMERNAEGGRRPIRILSAGCATGEEPYSISMALAEHDESLLREKSEILGADVCNKFLDRARRGSYHQWTLRSTPSKAKERYFRENGSRVLLDTSQLPNVSFERHNLVEEESSLWRPGRFDAIFLRNVIMYLTAEATGRLIQQVTTTLSPGGFLFLGHAESLRGITNRFHLLQHKDSFFYRLREGTKEKALSAEPVAEEAEGRSCSAASAFDGCVDSNDPTESDWVAMVCSATERITRLASKETKSPPTGRQREDEPTVADTPGRNTGEGIHVEACRLVSCNRHEEALALMREAGPSRRDDPDVLLLKARILIGLGRTEPALDTIERLIRIDELNAAARYLRGECFERLDDVGEAIRSHRAAVYLDSRMGLAHLHLGLLYKKRGESHAALRELRQAAELLPGEDGARILLLGEGVSRSSLLKLCLDELQQLRDLKR